MRNNPRCLYDSSFREFIGDLETSILGTMCDHYHGIALTTTREAWKAEISIMQETLFQCRVRDGHIIFEYDIPRLGKRIDVVLLLNGIIFCIEFKVGESQKLEADMDQVLDYALDLKNFHKYSQDKVIVPILVPTEYRNIPSKVQPSGYDNRVIDPLVTGKTGLPALITAVLNEYPNEEPVNHNWIISPYAPTPTIIEAARTLYENHSVENITRHEADNASTDRTIKYILQIIKKSKEKQQKSICFVTGVPGAGKTLVGLDVAVKQTYQGNHEPVKDEGAVYLSGNGPLVAVLTEALAQDNYKRCRERNEQKKITESRREVSKSIQMIHRYRDNMLAKIKNPVENGQLEIDPKKAVKQKNAGFGEVEHVAIFDEAQRSWTHKRLADYLKRGGTYGNKLKVPNFPLSEAAFLIWSLDQREDWATIICLVGGGQEINTGEAGISEWIKAINEKFPHWNVYISPKLTDMITNNSDGEPLETMLSIWSHTSYNAPSIQNRIVVETQRPYPQQTAAVENWKENDMTKHMLPLISLSADESSLISGKKTDIETYMKEMVYGFIMGSEALDNYDDFVNQLYSLGLQDVLDTTQTAVDRYNER